MNALRYPSMREEIVAAVDDLAEPFDASDSSRSRFLEIYLLLYEDAGLDTDPPQGVGDFFKDAAEATAVSNLAQPLKQVMDEAGPYATDIAYQGTASWRLLVNAARDARKALRTK